MTAAFLILFFIASMSSAEAWGVERSINLKRQLGAAVAGFGLALGPMLMPPVETVYARPEGVNRPELLPKTKGIPLIDTGEFLGQGPRKEDCGKVGGLREEDGYQIAGAVSGIPRNTGIGDKRLLESR